MTSEVKDEIELLMDVINEQASSLDDWASDEKDECEFEDDLETRKQLVFNANTLQKAKTQLEAAKLTLQSLIDKN